MNDEKFCIFAIEFGQIRKPNLEISFVYQFHLFYIAFLQYLCYFDVKYFRYVQNSNVHVLAYKK